MIEQIESMKVGAVRESGVKRTDEPGSLSTFDKKLWFQTAIDFKYGEFVISVFKTTDTFFEVEVGRGNDYETRTFMCSSIEQVDELQAFLIRQSQRIYRGLKRIGWLNEAGELYPFKVGDQVRCKDQRKYQLDFEGESSQNVILLDSNHKKISQCTASSLFKCLYGDNPEDRRLATHRSLITGEIVYASVCCLERQ